ncbi:hypothetical protein EV1_046854 [Malus domestica]
MVDGGSTGSSVSTISKPRSRHRQLTSTPATMLPENPVLADSCAAFIACRIALFFLLLWQETAKRGSCFISQPLSRILLQDLILFS